MKNKIENSTKEAHLTLEIAFKNLKNLHEKFGKLQVKYNELIELKAHQEKELLGQINTKLESTALEFDKEYKNTNTLLKTMYDISLDSLNYIETNENEAFESCISNVVSEFSQIKKCSLPQEDIKEFNLQNEDELFLYLSNELKHNLYKIEEFDKDIKEKFIYVSNNFFNVITFQEETFKPLIRFLKEIEFLTKNDIIIWRNQYIN